MSRQLPPQPHIDVLKKQARQLLNQHTAGQPEAVCHHLGRIAGRCRYHAQARQRRPGTWMAGGAILWLTEPLDRSCVSRRRSRVRVPSAAEPTCPWCCPPIGGPKHRGEPDPSYAAVAEHIPIMLVTGIFLARGVDLAAAQTVIRDIDMPFFDHILGIEGGFDAAVHGILELVGIAGRADGRARQFSPRPWRAPGRYRLLRWAGGRSGPSPASVRSPGCGAPVRWKTFPVPDGCAG